MCIFHTRQYNTGTVAPYKAFQAGNQKEGNAKSAHKKGCSPASEILQQTPKYSLAVSYKNTT